MLNKIKLKKLQQKFGRAQYCRSFIIIFEITLVSTDERECLCDVVEAQPNLAILGNKGYAGERFSREISEKEICLMTLKHSNSKTDWSKLIRLLS